MTPGTEGLFSSMFLIPPAIVAAVVIGVSVFTIFKFKNRMLQMKLVSVAMFFNIILILLVLFIYVPKLEEATKVTAEYVSHAGIYLPLVSLIMLILSNQAIRRDERKVRSLDRLR
jgi:glucan phosphoethanolaminetransferase (alkaline phosphatase superfamily)